MWTTGLKFDATKDVAATDFAVSAVHASQGRYFPSV